MAAKAKAKPTERADRPADPVAELSPARRILRRWEEMKTYRSDWESTWEDIGRFFLPGRKFNSWRVPGELRDRRLVDSTGLVNNERLAAMLFGFSITGAQPFIRPDVDQALRRAGRKVGTLDEEGRDYLDDVMWGQHQHLMSAKSGFAVGANETLMECPAFGTGIIWTGRKRGFGARYQSRPLQNSWIATNADDEVDTCYYAFELPAWRVVERWPATAELDCVKQAQKRGDAAKMKLLMAVEPRAGGRYGAMAASKPFKACLVLVEAKEIIEESGYDSFPYAVPRFFVRPGEVYGYGPAHNALSDCRMLNAIMEAVISGAEKIVDPPVIAALRMFGKPVDRRRGAVNYYQASQLGLQTAEQAVRPLVQAGDIKIGVELVREIRRQIDYTFYVDWMRLGENANMTATEVNDRRDMRLRGMASIVARVERDLMGPIAERTFEISVEDGLFADPPASVAGLDIGWSFTGPMAMAQLQQQRDAISLSVSLAKQIAELEAQGKPGVLDTEEAQRIFGESTGLAPAVLKTRAAMAEIRAAQDAAEAQAAETQNTAGQAAALRDGAQGVNSLVQAMGAGGGGGEQMAMAA